MRTDLAYLGSSYERLVFGRHPRTRRIVRLKKLRMAERAGLQDYTLLADFLRWGCWVRYRRLGTSDACLAFVSRRRAGQRLGIVSHISRLSRANERNHPAAAKRLWRDSRVLSRVCLAPGSRVLFFCLRANAHRCSIFRFRGYRAVCAPFCAPCPSCVLLSFAIYDRFFEKPWFYQVTLRSYLGRTCATYVYIDYNIVMILISISTISIHKYTYKYNAS